MRGPTAWGSAILGVEGGMPLALILGVLDVVLVIHAAKTGRFSPWAYIILMIPLFGSLAYVGVELVPEWLGSYQGQKGKKRFVATLDPQRGHPAPPEGPPRARPAELPTTDTIPNRDALAAECVGLGKFDEAIHHYNEIIARPLGD